MTREEAIRETVLEAMNEARRLSREEEWRHPEWQGMTHTEKTIARQWGGALSKAVDDIMSLLGAEDQPEAEQPEEPKDAVDVAALRKALLACGRLAYRMDHSQGHTLDRENARAIARIVHDTVGGR